MPRSNPPKGERRGRTKNPAPDPAAGIFCQNCGDPTSELESYCPSCGTLLPAAEEE